MVLASTDVNPSILSDDKVDPLITYQTTSGEIYTVYDDGSCKQKTVQDVQGLERPTAPVTQPATPVPTTSGGYQPRHFHRGSEGGGSGGGQHIHTAGGTRDDG